MIDRIFDWLLILAIGIVTSLELVIQHRNARKAKNGQRPYHEFMMTNLILYFPMFFLGFLPFGVFDCTWYIQNYADFVISIFLYHVLLLPVLPLLRRKFSSRCCGVLWLLPAILYYVCVSDFYFIKPLLVLPITAAWIPALGYVWLGGSITVMIWKIVQHLLYRRRILRNAEPVKEQRVLDVWKAERSWVFPGKENWELVISPNVRSPLSIGIFEGTTTVVLPDKEYTDDELKLIFRHELIHISRGDGKNKFFMAFCTAICWFNPLMWLSMRKSAEDFELSCDESVLLDEEDAVRRQYAGLILNTAGEEKGFTTCLAASASALRYRLKNIVRGRKLRSGALLTFALCLLLMATMGMVALGYDYSTAWEAVEDRTQENILLEKVTPNAAAGQCPDVQEIQSLLENMQLCRLVSDRRDDGQVFATLQFSNGVEVILRTNTLTLRGGGEEKVTYYIINKSDRDYLESLFA